MFGCEKAGLTVAIPVDDEVDPTLSVQGDVLGAVIGHCDEAEGFKQPLERACIRGREFDELEAVEAHGVIPGGGGGERAVLECCLHDRDPFRCK